MHPPSQLLLVAPTAAGPYCAAGRTACFRSVRAGGDVDELRYAVGLIVMAAIRILGKPGMLQPRAAITAGCESGRQISGRISAQRHEINGLPPFRRLIGAASGNHLADDARQQIGGVLPSDQFETLEALVAEIK
jgi:hypothetical protein